MRIWAPWYNTSKKSLKWSYDENWIKRIIPHWWTSRDNWQNSFWNDVSKINEREWRELWLSKQITKRQSIQEWLQEYYAWNIDVETVGSLKEYREKYIWIVPEIEDGNWINWQEIVNFNTFWAITFNYDKSVKLVNKDIRFFELFDKNPYIRIVNWDKEFRENTLLFAYSKDWKESVSMPLKTLRDYIFIPSDNYRDYYMKFFDKYHFTEIDLPKNEKIWTFYNSKTLYHR